ncbi:MAG: DUF255 domain-containing protein [Firmicutes bacterium]|nr:DUF255 domain-containing protein [Bacillota bacterium]
MALNRLADSKNPYLLQHAGNPVDWYPWSDEAFLKAAAEDKPIFILRRCSMITPCSRWHISRRIR